MDHCQGIVAVLANMTHFHTGYLLPHYGVSVQDLASVTIIYLFIYFVFSNWHIWEK